MGNLLLVYESNMATVEIMKECYTGIFSGTKVSYRFVRTWDLQPVDLNWCDLIILIRPSDYVSYTVAKVCIKRNKTVAVFWDDDVPLLSDSVSNLFFNKSRQSMIIKILKKSNLIITPSPYIGKKYCNYTLDKKYLLINTLVSEEELQLIPNCHSDVKIRMVYAAGASHELVFTSFVGPVIEKILNKYNDNISLDFVGVRPMYDTLSRYPQVSYHQSMPLEEYRAFMRDKCFDIGLSPLFDDEFHRSKYFNKFLEYTLAGAVGIYSSCAPYTFVVTDKINGFLANNTIDGWYTAICSAIDNAELRKSCLSNAIDALKDNFRREKLLDIYTNAFPFLMSEHINRNKKYYLFLSKLCARTSYNNYLCRVALNNLRKNGLKNTIHKIIKRL